MTAAAAASAALFFVLWWMLQAEDNPWVPAGLAASVVMLVAALARIAVVRRMTHYIDEQGSRDRPGNSVRRPSRQVMHSTSSHSAALRALQRKSAEADARELPPTAHREIFELCTNYLNDVEHALLSPGLPAEGRLAMRGGQERVRTLQRHHLLTWARGSARALTHEAQRRVRLYEKVETANRALECIDFALKVYPDEEELQVSALAVRAFITSSRVAHWVEQAERAAFKGYYRRAIDRYQDALFYLARDGPDQDREAGAGRIAREIDLLRARLASGRATIDSSKDSTKNTKQEP